MSLQDGAFTLDDEQLNGLVRQLRREARTDPLHTHGALLDCAVQLAHKAPLYALLAGEPRMHTRCFAHAVQRQVQADSMAGTLHFAPGCISVLSPLLAQPGPATNPTPPCLRGLASFLLWSRPDERG